MSEKKQTILEWYQANHKFIDAPCNGNGYCGRCKIKMLSDASFPQEKEKKLLTEAELEAGVRLACVTKMEEGMQFEPVGVLLHPEQMVIPEGTGNGRSIVTEEISKIEESVKIKENESMGIALDIGTTTLAMALVSLGSGTCIRIVTSVNSQRTYGADVISRIQAANQGNDTELQKSILLDIWKLLQELIHTTGISPMQMKKMVVAGNTTMCHLLLGYSCEGLGRTPFITEHTELRKLDIRQLFAPIEPLVKTDDIYGKFCTEVLVLPGISAFVGADIVAGMYFCDMDLSKDEQMLLDIGTNGEIAVGSAEGFWVTSTAAGPVFEGGTISCGIPAVKGAVAHAKLEMTGEKELRWNCEILGEEAYTSKVPKGICGSGLIDCVAELWKEGLLDENGTLIDSFFETGVPIKQLRISQSDIRQLQMGKAAIRAGIEILLEKFSIKKLYLAGGFGTELSIDSAIGIGLLPKEIKNGINPIGNASLLGLQKFLTDEWAEERVQNIVEKSKEIVLAEDGNFEEKYILFMQFLL